MTHLNDPDDHTVRAALTGSYVLDPSHTRLGFVARHAMVTKVRGSFIEFEGGGFFDVENNADRDPHRRSNDLFDTETYPEISFKSTAFEQLVELYWVTGDLTIKGITRPVPVDFEFTGAVIDRSATSGSASRARTTVNRNDWGGNWNAALEAGGVLVSVKVTLEFRRVRYPDRGSASKGTMLPLLARG